MDKNYIVEMFKSGIDCGQVVAGEFEKETTMSLSDLRKITACYAAGMLRGETCGAVIAAYSVIGAIYGHSEPNDDEKKGRMLKKMLRFNEMFGEKYDGFMCRELLGADISTPEGGKKIADENLLFEICPKIVSDVTEILKHVIDEDAECCKVQ